jgi:hypothetical protein
MSLIDSNNTLLREQAGKGKIDIIFSGESVNGADYFKVYMPIATTLDLIELPNLVTGSESTLLGIPLPAGTTLNLRCTRLGVQEGLAICYTENDGDRSN